jgi:methyl-accepting chemotaxis protein
MDQTIITAQAGAAGIKTGVSVVNSAGETFEKIVGSITKFSQQTKEITDCTKRTAAAKIILILLFLFLL